MTLAICPCKALNFGSDLPAVAFAGATDARRPPKSRVCGGKRFELFAKKTRPCCCWCAKRDERARVEEKETPVRFVVRERSNKTKEATYGGLLVSEVYSWIHSVIQVTSTGLEKVEAAQFSIASQSAKFVGGETWATIPYFFAHINPSSHYTCINRNRQPTPTDLTTNCCTYTTKASSEHPR